MNLYRIIKPGRTRNFDEALSAVTEQIRLLPQKPSFIKLFCSDAQNQAGKIREAIRQIDCKAVTFVEQPPLDGSRVCALVHSAAPDPGFVFHSFRLSEEEAAGLDSYAQTRLLFDRYRSAAAGMNMATHLVRTWIYVRDIDANYAGVVRARNDVFAEEGLSHTNHYIASTGIGGGSESRSALVSMDFLSYPGIKESDKTYLKALSHLSPTHDYGVAFERGVKVSLPGGSRYYIRGTASIDSKGRVLHEGDVIAQTDRLLENIDTLLQEGGSSLDDAKYFIVYLRDISDFAAVKDYMQRRFPDKPHVILEGRVCRPSWLIEMETEA